MVMISPEREDDRPRIAFKDNVLSVGHVSAAQIGVLPRVSASYVLDGRGGYDQRVPRKKKQLSSSRVAGSLRAFKTSLKDTSGALWVATFFRPTLGGPPLPFKCL